MRLISLTLSFGVKPTRYKTRAGYGTNAIRLRNTTRRVCDMVVWGSCNPRTREGNPHSHPNRVDGRTSRPANRRRPSSRSRQGDIITVLPSLYTKKLPIAIHHSSSNLEQPTIQNITLIKSFAIKKLQHITTNSRHSNCNPHKTYQE